MVDPHLPWQRGGRGLGVGRAKGVAKQRELQSKRRQTSFALQYLKLNTSK